MNNQKHGNENFFWWIVLACSICVLMCGCDTRPDPVKATIKQVAAGERLEFEEHDSSLRGRQYIVRDRKTGREFLYFYDVNNSCVVEIRQAD